MASARSFSVLFTRWSHADMAARGQSRGHWISSAQSFFGSFNTLGTNDPKMSGVNFTFLFLPSYLKQFFINWDEICEGSLLHVVFHFDM